MNKIFSFILASVFVLGAAFSVSTVAEAAVRVKGYMKSNGTYVMPSYRSSPNKYKFDNYSTKGNYNPYSGRKGYVNPYRW